MIASAQLSYDPDGLIMGALCICDSELRAHRTPSMQCPNDWPGTFRPATDKDYGGDLFGTCEEGQHAWRPSYAASGYPTPPVACKWCGNEKVAPDMRPGHKIKLTDVTTGIQWDCSSCPAWGLSPNKDGAKAEAAKHSCIIREEAKSWK